MALVFFLSKRNQGYVARLWLPPFACARPMFDPWYKHDIQNCIITWEDMDTCNCIVGSVVECSPATRAAQVRFPDNANYFLEITLDLK